MAGIINLRMPAPAVQKALNLNNAEFGNLKVHARTTHVELLKKPDFKWKDPRLVWDAVPAKEKEVMHEIMWAKCSCLFEGSSVPEETIIRGIEQRVYDVRKNWVIRYPKDKGQHSSTGEPSATPPTAPAGSVHAYDPVRDT